MGMMILNAACDNVVRPFLTIVGLCDKKLKEKLKVVFEDMQKHVL